MKLIIDKHITFALLYGANTNTFTKKDGTAQIKIRAYKDRRIKYIGTGVYVEPRQWKNGTVIKHLLKDELNQRLRTQLNELEAFVSMQIKKYGKCSLAALDRVGENDSSLTFTAFMQSQIETRTIQPQSKKPHRTTLNKLRDFYKKEIDFEDLNYKFLRDFELYLIAQGLSINTRARNFKTLRAYINEAIRYDYMDLNRNPFIKFKFKEVPVVKQPLNLAQLEILAQWIAPPQMEHLERVRDFFLIACYTGLRFSDVSRLTVNHFKETPEGLILRINTMKTSKLYEQNTRFLFRANGENESRLERILSRYLRAAEAVPGVPFLKYTNQYINRELKELFAILLDIQHDEKDKISSHYARHTFITIMAQFVTAPVLQRMAQHSKLSITQGYINLSQDDINKELQSITIG
jgi:integrase